MIFLRRMRLEGKEDGYYTGNIIVYDKNEKVNGIITMYDVIDGQQRIATFFVDSSGNICTGIGKKFFGNR